MRNCLKAAARRCNANANGNTYFHQLYLSPIHSRQINDLDILNKYSLYCEGIYNNSPFDLAGGGRANERADAARPFDEFIRIK